MNWLPLVVVLAVFFAIEWIAYGAGTAAWMTALVFITVVAVTFLFSRWRGRRD